MAGVRVARLDVAPSLATPPEWVGSVWFEGQVTLSGRYGPHHDHPEPDLVCFFPDADSAARLPRFPYDERISWFCFTNRDEAAKALQPPPATGTATVTIDGYEYHYAHSDVVNAARLVRVEAAER